MWFSKQCISFLLVSSLTSSTHRHGVHGETDFNWNITEPSNWTVTFKEGPMGEAITGIYGLPTGKHFIVRMKTGDNCEHEANEDNLSAIEAKVQVLDRVGGPGGSIFNSMDPADPYVYVGDPDDSSKIDLKIVPNALSLEGNTAAGDNQIFDTSNPALSILKFCLRLDLLQLDSDFNNQTSTSANATSVNFHETKLQISIDMTKTFEITEVSTERTEATSIDKNATLAYNITTALADPIGTGDIITNPNTTLWAFSDPYAVRNGKPFAVLTCMDNLPTDGGIQFKEVSTFKISNANNFAGENALDMTTFAGGSLLVSNCDVKDGKPCCIVQTLLRSDFYDDYGTGENLPTSPLPVKIDGTTVMEFVSGGTTLRRKLQISGGGQPGDGQFELQANLVSDNDFNTPSQEESSATTKMMAASCMAVVLGGVLAFM